MQAAAATATTAHDDPEEDASLIARGAMSVSASTATGAAVQSFVLSHEVWLFARTALPNGLVAFFMFMQFSSTVVIGSKYLGVEEMSAITLASLVSNLSALTVIYGLLSAVDTLAPQSFGAGNYAQLSVLVARGIVVVSCTLPFTLLVWWNAEPLLLAVGQPKHESRMAGVFLRYHFFTLPGLLLWESFRRFLWCALFPRLVRKSGGGSNMWRAGAFCRSQSHVSQWPFVLIVILALGTGLPRRRANARTHTKKVSTC